MLTASEARGGWIIVTAEVDIDLPDCETSSVGMNVCIEQGDASETISVAALVDSDDDMLYEGVLIGAENELDSPGGAGDRGSHACFICTEDDLWRVKGDTGWTDGAAID